MATEDFRTYTEVESSDRFSAAASVLTVTQLARADVCYAYSDKGAGHFAANFEHLVKFTRTGISGYGNCVCWAVTNVLDIPGRTWDTSNLQAVSVYFERTNRIRMESHEYNSIDGYDSVGVGPYWLKIKRVDDTTSCYIYSDASRTTLVDTLAVVETVPKAMRYVYAAANLHVAGNADWMSALIEDLDLQEGGAPASSIAAIAAYYRRLAGGV